MAVAKSQFALIYRNVPSLLREMRGRPVMTQEEYAKKISKSQSWVFKSVAASRRIDISEFLEWCLGCGVDPIEAFTSLLKARR